MFSKSLIDESVERNKADSETGIRRCHNHCCKLKHRKTHCRVMGSIFTRTTSESEAQIQIREKSWRKIPSLKVGRQAQTSTFWVLAATKNQDQLIESSLYNRTNILKPCISRSSIRQRTNKTRKWIPDRTFLDRPRIISGNRYAGECRGA